MADGRPAPMPQPSTTWPKCAASWRASRRTGRRSAAVLRRGARSPAGVATIAAALGLVALIGFDDLSAWLRSDIYAGVGDRKSVTLEDGSRVELDARSAHCAAFRARPAAADAARGRGLVPGRAGCDARPSSWRRPAGRSRRSARRSTSRVDKGEARVTVTEHRVEVASGGGAVIVEEGAQSAFSRRPRRPGARIGRRQARHRLAARQADLREQAARRSARRARAPSTRLCLLPRRRELRAARDRRVRRRAIRPRRCARSRPFSACAPFHVTDYLILLHG